MKKKAILLYDMVILSLTKKKDLEEWMIQSSHEWTRRDVPEGVVYERRTPTHYVLRIFVMCFYYTYVHVYIELPVQYVCQNHLFLRLSQEWETEVRFSNMIRSWLPEYPDLFFYDFFECPLRPMCYDIPNSIVLFLQDIDYYVVFLQGQEQSSFQKQKQLLVRQWEEELMKVVWHPRRFSYWSFELTSP